MKQQKSKFFHIHKDAIFKDKQQQKRILNEELKQSQNFSQTSKDDVISESSVKFIAFSPHSPKHRRSEESSFKEEFSYDYPMESQIIHFGKEEQLEQLQYKSLKGYELYSNKFSALFSMLILFAMTLILYYTFLFFHISPLISNSNVGPNIQFWLSNLWEDQIYSKAVKELICLHIILIFFLAALLQTAFVSPGLIPPELKGPQLLTSQIRKLEEMCRFADYNSQFRQYSISSRDNLSEKRDDDKKSNLKDISIITNIQGQQGENIDKNEYEIDQSRNLEEHQSLMKKDFSQKNSQAVFQFFKQSIEHKTKKNFWGKPRYCKSCHAYKPDRSHHCSICDKCILKMDHHCPFVNNCIGFYNYKYFMLMLIYSDIMLIFFAVIFVETLTQILNDNSRTSLEIGYFMSIYIIICLLSLVITGFGLFHFYMIFNGLTTIEYREKMQKNYTISPYNISYYFNFCLVFGTNPLFWFMPFNTNKEGEGIKHRSNRKQNF